MCEYLLVTVILCIVFTDLIYVYDDGTLLLGCTHTRRGYILR